jgi:hypothetical protein
MRNRPIALVCSVLLLAPFARVAAQYPPAGAPYARPVIPASFHIDTVLDGGRFVYLEDSTRWEVAPADQPTAAAWQRDESVVVRRIPAPTGEFEFQLQNAEQNQSVAARFAGRPRKSSRPRS